MSGHTTRSGRPHRGDTLEVLHLRADGTAAFLSIPHTLAELQRLVGGLIEPISLSDVWHRRHVLALVNEEATLRRPTPRWNPFSGTLLAPPASELYGLSGRQILGNAVILREHGEEFVSLTATDREDLEHLLDGYGVRLSPTAGL